MKGESIKIDDCMELSEVINEIRRRKKDEKYIHPKNKEGLWRQKDFSKAIGADGSLLSKLAEGGGDKGAGATWNQHWRQFLKILDLCDEVGLDPRAQKVEAHMTPKEFKSKVEAILTRLMLHEKPRQQLKKQIVEMVEGAYENAVQHKPENPGVSLGIQENRPTTRKDPAR